MKSFRDPAVHPAWSNVFDPNVDDVSANSPDPDDITLRAFFTACLCGPFGAIMACLYWRRPSATGVLTGLSSFACWLGTLMAVAAFYFLRIQSMEVPCSESSLRACEETGKFPCLCYAQVGAIGVICVVVATVLLLSFGPIPSLVVPSDSQSLRSPQ